MTTFLPVYRFTAVREPSHSSRGVRFPRLCFLRVLALLGMAILLAAHAASAQAPAAEEDTTEEEFDAPPPAVEPLPPPAGAEIDEIVVTATKREQSLQDVPISISALTGAALEDSGITDFDVLSEFVPNLQINAVTDTRQTAIRVRGIGQTGFNAGIEPSVGVLIDDVFQGRTGMSAALDLLDIERVEVLRGPQGTLFGKNTAAGAIRIITRKPVFEQQATLQGVLGSYEDREFRGAVNVPIFDDKLATRISGYRVTRDGFDRNLTNLKRVNNADKSGFRMRTLYLPTDNLEILLTGDWANQDDTCCVSDIITYDGPGQLDVTFADLADVTGIPLPKTDPFDRVVDANEKPVNDTTIWGTTIEANYDILNGWLSDHTLTSLTAYRSYETNSFLDGDFSIYDAVIQTIGEDFEQASTELRLTSPGGEKLEYVGGLYFYYQRDQTDDNTGIGPDFLAVDTPINTLLRLSTGDDDYVDSRNRNDYKTYSYAAFGQGTYYLHPKWSLTAGLRLNYERKTRKGTQVSDFQLPVGIFGPDIALDEDFDVFNPSPMGALRFFPTEDAMIYASVAQGFKSGGFNQLRTQAGRDTQFDDEKSTNIELGARTTWFDKMITANATFFYTLYEDFQAQSFDGTSIFVTNAGNLTSYGFEGDLVVVPHPYLFLGTSFGYTHARYDDFDSAECTADQVAVQGQGCTQDLAGRRLDNAPEWTTFSFAQFDYPLPWTPHEWIGEMAGFLRAEHSYSSFLYLAQDLDPHLKQNAYSLVNLRSGLRAEDGRWEFTLWVRNLLDEGYNVVGFDTPIISGFAAVNGPPREYGATMTLNF